MNKDAEWQRGDGVPEIAEPDGRLVLQATLRVAARLLHKEYIGIRDAHLCFAFFLQIHYFFKWSRGDSNP